MPISKYTNMQIATMLEHEDGRMQGCKKVEKVHLGLLFFSLFANHLSLDGDLMQLKTS